MRLIAFFLALTLAACGADGPPEPVATKPGISIGGEVSVGISGN